MERRLTDILEILENGRIDWSDEHQTTTTIVTKNERLAIAEIKKLRAHVAELATENIVLREALKFYSCACDIADKRSQRCGGAHDEQFCGYVALATLDGETG